MVDSLVQGLGCDYQGTKVGLYWHMGAILVAARDWLVPVGTELRLVGHKSVTLTTEPPLLLSSHLRKAFSSCRCKNFYRLDALPDSKSSVAKHRGYMMVCDDTVSSKLLVMNREYLKMFCSLIFNSTTVKVFESWAVIETCFLILWLCKLPSMLWHCWLGNRRASRL